jgi:transcriptional regulator with XRE-family HTH domain
MTDLTAAQSRMARAALKWSLHDAAAKSGVTYVTISRFECGKGKCFHSTKKLLRRAYEEAGVMFFFTYNDELVEGVMPPRESANDG